MRGRDASSLRAGPGLLFRTIRELPAGRVLQRLARPARGAPRRLAHAAGLGPGPVVPADLPGFQAPPLPSGTWSPPSRFELLGVSRDLGAPMDWSLAPTKLWAYQVHALDALRESQPVARRLALLDRWSEANPFASRPGWDPYPTSLRIVNALELLLAAGFEGTRAAAIADQAWWLEGNVENDVGANHLFKNALALAWAGRALRGRSAERWRARGDALLARELLAQLLPDGFHVERSPGYHAVLVDDLIRFERLLRAAGEADGAFARGVIEARRRAAAALASIVHPDGDIPLFNDAALGQAPPGAWILDRATELDAVVAPTADPRGAPAAGLHRLAGDASVVLFDAGDIGFDGQPAHAHADTLSFELSYGTTRVVVDAGVFDYEATPERAYARSTRSHNTLELDGVDQSEMWGVFRVGRRARPLDVRREETGARAAIEASHDGYRHLRGGPVHRRRMEHLGGDVWLVEDTVSGGDEHCAVSRIRLHPRFATVAERDGVLEAAAGSVAVRIVASSPRCLTVERGSYYPSFGRSESCLVVCLTAAGPLPLTIAYRLELSTLSPSERPGA